MEMRRGRVILLSLASFYVYLFYIVVSVDWTEDRKLATNKDILSDSERNQERSFRFNDRFSKSGNRSTGSVERNRGKDNVQTVYQYLEGSIFRPITYLPIFPPKNVSNIVPYLNSTITRKFLTLPIVKYTHEIVILSLIQKEERSLETFLGQLRRLSYPHHLLSVYFGVSSSTENTLQTRFNITMELKQTYAFKDIQLVDLKVPVGVNGPGKSRHEKEHQRYRRFALAAARNRLVRFALEHKQFVYVTFLDSEIEEVQADLLQHMLFAKSDVVVTSCLVKKFGYKYMYDFSSWRETNASLKKQVSYPPEDILLEGNDKSDRIFLPWLKHEGRVVQLDGVGGCALMVKADCFRSGLQFPEVAYKRHMETEGLAKMALDMGYSVVGLPFVEVFHENED